MMVVSNMVIGVGLAGQLWFWHAFANPRDPSNIYQNSANILFPSHTFDAYHLEHHKRMNTHWSKYPENVVKDMPRYIREGSICFRGLISREQLLFMLWMKRFDLLAAHFVNFGKEPRSKKKIAAFLEERTRPLEPGPYPHLYTACERALVGALARLSGVKLKSEYVDYESPRVEGWSAKMESFFPGTKPYRPFPIT